MTEPITKDGADSEQDAAIVRMVDAVMAKHPAADIGARRGLHMVTTGLVQVIGLAGREIAQLKREVAELRAQVARQAEAKSFPYQGTWRAGADYAAGTWITHAGSLWVTSEPTAARPGDGATPWRLMLKRGRDGRDARC